MNAQEAFALADKWPCWVSLAFGITCFLLSVYVQEIIYCTCHNMAASNVE